MNEWPASVAATVAAIEAAFDGRWGAWLSDTGWWWAARTQVLTAGEHAAGCLPYIHADNPDELTERIRQQDELTQPIPPEPAGPVTPAHGSRHQPGLPIRHQAPVAGEPMTPASTVTRAATTTPPRTCERVFAGRPEQVREARKFVAAVLDGCPAADDVILCISELASNAVLHSDSRKTGCTFTVRAEVHQGDHIRVEVEDNGGPWENRADHDGRPHGLDIIASLAADWAADGSPLTGWTVWARLDWPSADPHAADGHQPRTVSPAQPSPQGQPAPAHPQEGPPMQTLSDQPIPTRSARAQRHYTVLDGLLLRKLRREHGLSQEKLASLAGISLTTIARLEGQPRPPCRCRTLARLATALGEPPDTLDPSLDVPPASQTSEAT